MRPYLFCILLSIYITTGKCWAQSIPVRASFEEENYRNRQLLGELDSTISFTVRPLYTREVSKKYDDSASSGAESHTRIAYYSANRSVRLELLPLSFYNQYNSDHPYGWNDGPMIPAKGYQTMISAGFFAKLGPLNIQLLPEYVFAENKSFESFDIYNGKPDISERFGDKPYSKFNWGQSSLRLDAGPVSFGLSNENMWWGPGIQNSLLMTNNAQGFKHLIINSTRPIRTFLGSFEFQVIAGKLENSGYTYSTTDSIQQDWRYQSAFNISYQPKWVPGLFFGLSRSFQTYHNDLKSFVDYVPLFRPFQKSKDKQEDNIGSDDKDQLVSLYARWLFKKAHAEVYFEYGENDHSYNLRDLIQDPEHSRAYIFGITKINALHHRGDEFVKFNLEFTQMEQTIDRIIRVAGNWYDHYQIKQGYTNNGQIIGAGIGPGGDLQSFDISWMKKDYDIGLQFERYVHDDDYYKEYVGDLDGFSRKWVDLATNLHGTRSWGNIAASAELEFINSLNYQWKMKNYTPGTFYIPNNDVLNVHAELKIVYKF